MDVLAGRTPDLAARARRVLLIANPASRRGAMLHDVARAAFRAAGVRCDVVLTEYSGHAGEIASRLSSDYDALFALGGDGTAMEIVGAVAGRECPVGVLPGGTGNLVARSLGIPLDLPTAVRELLDGETAYIDLGMVEGGRRFAFAAGIGIDSRMVESTPAILKRRFGMLAYVMTAVRAVIANEAFEVRATVDGTVHQRRAVMVMVTNFGTVLNQLIALGPGISQDDGVLDLCVFSPGNLPDAIRIAWRLFRKDFRPDPLILYAPGHRFVIETSPVRRAQADGELLGPTPLVISVDPRAAKLLVPRRD